MKAGEGLASSSRETRSHQALSLQVTQRGLNVLEAGLQGGGD